MRVLVVDDVQDTTDSLVRSLEKAGHEATPAYSEKSAYEILKQNEFDVVVTDMLMERPESGLEVLREAKKHDPHVEVILLTAYAEVNTAVPAMRMGAFDYVRKVPEDPGTNDIYDIVLDKVDRALITKQLCDSFDEKEIAALCLLLGFDYEELPRESKRDKIVHLINELSRDGELRLLESLIKEIRPDLLGPRTSDSDAAEILYKAVGKVLERNPDIISEAYDGILRNLYNQSKPDVPKLCQAIFSNTNAKADKVENDIDTDTSRQSYLPASPILMVPDTHYESDMSDWKVDRVPTRRHTFLKADVVEHSKIVKQHKTELVNETFNRFELFVVKEIEERDGEIWSWQGDGGLFVFSGPDCEDRAALSATSILTGMCVFNIERNLLPVGLDVCIAIHTGYVTVAGEKGSIHSEVINYVSNLEENAVERNTICISNDVFAELSMQIRRHFFLKGLFEGKEIYVYGG